MPRVSLSTDYLLDTSCRTLDCLNRYYRTPCLITRVNNVVEQPSTFSPNDIDEILSRKLYNQLKTASILEKEQKFEYNASPSLSSVPHSPSTTHLDPELIVLIERFFNLTYLNTIPMVNLLATAVATHFLKENIRELDNKLQEQQAPDTCVNIKRGTSLLDEAEDDEGDDNLSWVSAPT